MIIGITDMETPKFTKGPWEFDGKGRIDAVAFRNPTGHMVIKDDGSKEDYIGGLVALPYSCSEDGSVIENHAANARLIAASPEMFDALAEALEYFEDREDADHNGARFVANKEMQIAEMIRLALRKALGTSN